jgi:hypothetical protein
MPFFTANSCRLPPKAIIVPQSFRVKNQANRIAVREEMATRGNCFTLQLAHLPCECRRLGIAGQSMNLWATAVIENAVVRFIPNSLSGIASP